MGHAERTGLKQGVIMVIETIGYSMLPETPTWQPADIRMRLSLHYPTAKRSPDGSPHFRSPTDKHNPFAEPSGKRDPFGVGIESARNTFVPLCPTLWVARVPCGKLAKA
ncbi:hypothetical protein Q31b_36930 [Novipirellula aureliae]|uniref:Uncharacterized protein n=1 Tax=Novipirellula aureliae TaxID=2527966 RepID=A0A5C6DVS3_9BACT|nr:hypothetical protein Q31b_36930 [Novipirellula aureliae]